MQFTKLVLCLVFVCIGSTQAAPQQKTQEQVSSLAPVYVGQFGNKTYYRDAGPYAWNDGMKACESNGMTLVSMETREEQTYLRQTLSGTGGLYWTSGIEKFYLGPAYYEWGVNGLSVELWYGGTGNYKNCLSVYDNLSFQLQLCNVRLAILCQKLEAQPQQQSRTIGEYELQRKTYEPSSN